VTEDFVDCDVHGRSLPAFVCVHLLDGDGLGFNHSDLDSEDDESRPNAWCGDCEQRRLSTGGEWTDDSEPKISLLCASCWDRARKRNRTGREDD